MQASVEIESRTWLGIVWVWFIAATLVWTRLNRLIGRERVNGWALNGCFRLCWVRTRIDGGPWSPWRRAYRRTPDGRLIYTPEEA